MIIHNNDLLSQLRSQYMQYKGAFKRINVFGILDETKQKDDIFNDYLGMNIGDDVWIWKSTCNPGKHATDTKEGGAAHLVYAYQHEIWTLDMHAADNPSFAHEALCNRKQYGCKPTTVFRNKNKDGVFELGESIETDYYGINCHRASVASTISTIGDYSFGCVVTPDKADFEWFIATLKKQQEITTNYHYLFGFLMTRIEDWKLA
jgi:hypothetical protein